MGCVQLKIRPRITLEYDLGNIPSSESSPTSVSATPPKTPETSPTGNPLLQKNVSDFVKFRRAAHQCYFCGSSMAYCAGLSRVGVIFMDTMNVSKRGFKTTTSAALYARILSTTKSSREGGIRVTRKLCV